jgi:microsomal dipeptidase-like Zn-dependent dipeptidase
VILGAVAMSILHFGVLPHIDAKENRVLAEGPYSASGPASSIHDAAFVADLHADSLLWRRDLRSRNSRGHVDLPRLRDGGVDLQVFSVVTKVSRVRNYDSNAGDKDSLPLLFIASGRPPSTWFDPKARALIQAQELRSLAETTELSLVLRRSDLDLEGIKGLLSLEGMHGLKGGEADLAELHAAGFRMMGLVHFFDNEVAGSAHGIEKYGLTALGRSLIPRMESLGITIDLAHASPASIEDTLNIATKPLVVSHGGVQVTCPGRRNLSDAQLRRIAQNGGVVGIGYWKGAVCDVSVAGIVAAMLHVIAVTGIDHVALGSDFDGTITSPFDTAGLPLLTEALLEAGLSEEGVTKVLGGNARRVLAANLPE